MIGMAGFIKGLSIESVFEPECSGSRLAKLQKNEEFTFVFGCKRNEEIGPYGQTLFSSFTRHIIL